MATTTPTHADPHHARIHVQHVAGDGHHHHDAAHHEHGTMDVRTHERVFEGFVKTVTWSIILSLAVVVFLALTNA